MNTNILLKDTNSWLSAIESENTSRNYLGHVNDFCLFVFHKKLSDINKEILVNKNIDYSIMLKYKEYLTDIKNYSGQTVRTKIYAVKSWFNYLYRIGKYNIESPDLLKLDKKIMPKIKGNNGSKPFTHNEMVSMINKAKEYNNGILKSLLLEFAYITAWRKEAIISSLTYGDIYKIKDNTNYWLVDIIDKGEKEDTKAISNDLYNRIMSLKGNKQEDELIFPLSNTSVDNLILQLKTDLNIQGNKSFHGIKKASVNRVLDLTDNLFKAQKHACHESIETTAKFYAKYNNNYEDSMSLHILDDIQINRFDDLSKEELLSLIMKSEDKIKFALLLELNKQKEKGE